jgi:hypothetical protein
MSPITITITRVAVAVTDLGITIPVPRTGIAIGAPIRVRGVVTWCTTEQQQRNRQREGESS